jgi:nicotinamidase/pyrazinamidase
VIDGGGATVHDPAAVAFDARTALVVVDVQNDFADPAGNLYVAGGEDVVGPVNALVAAAGRSGAPVVYTQDWHPEQTPHFVDGGGVWPVHCVRGTWGAALHPDLVVAGPTIRKGTGGEDGYSGFTVRDPATGAEAPTALAATLADHDVTALVVVGLARDVCVKETVLDARRLGYDVTVVLAATRPVEVRPGDDAAAVAAMEAAGAMLR